MELFRLLLVTIVVSGCATIHNGRKEQVSIAGNPSGADVIVDGELRGRTPLVLWLERDENHTIILKKPGFGDQDFNILRRTSGWIWGNLGLLPLAPIGFIVDFATGSAYKLKPTEVSADLKPVLISPAPDAEEKS